MATVKINYVSGASVGSNGGVCTIEPPLGKETVTSPGSTTNIPLSTSMAIIETNAAVRYIVHPASNPVAVTTDDIPLPASTGGYVSFIEVSSSEQITFMDL